MEQNRKEIFIRLQPAQHLPFTDDNKQVFELQDVSITRLTISTGNVQFSFQKLPFTELLIREAHQKNLQGGPPLTLQTLLRNIWKPLSCRKHSAKIKAMHSL